ncbi:hypothetical protein BDQ17DRAFT_1236873, partial [Cyathus striatus]
TALHRLRRAACLEAGHQSLECIDSPRCHPETRIAVLDDIMSWVNSETLNERILWLSGPPGAGKSSIAQTVSEKCHDESKLLSSFFFSRMDARRSDGNRLVPTIAYQLATEIPEANSIMIEQISDDISILKSTMAIQMTDLVLATLRRLETGAKKSQVSHIPYLVVIDGLDECRDSSMQFK